LADEYTRVNEGRGRRARGRGAGPA
jgi:hypothetical protein